MKKLLLAFFLFLSVGAIAQTKDTTNITSDMNPYNVLVVVDGGVYKGTVESIDPQIIESVNVLRGTNPTVIFRTKTVKGVILITTKNVKKQDNDQAQQKPLIIVDDQIYDRGINTLHDKDILTIDVLKGSEAIAVYGQNAVNGVITITTKQYYQVHIQNELAAKSKKYKQYLKRLDYLMVYKINDTPLQGNSNEIAKQIADIPEKNIVDVQTKHINYAGVDNVIVNIKTKN
jgi:TonB-dependent SusC/RagA subfamily outer membrane receptor